MKHNYTDKFSLLQRNLNNEILTVTVAIQREYPELYAHLSEMPLFLPAADKGLSLCSFERYLETLRLQLATFKAAALDVHIF